MRVPGLPAIPPPGIRIERASDAMAAVLQPQKKLREGRAWDLSFRASFAPLQFGVNVYGDFAGLTIVLRGPCQGPLRRGSWPELVIQTLPPSLENVAHALFPQLCVLLVPYPVAGTGLRGEGLLGWSRRL